MEKYKNGNRKLVTLFKQPERAVIIKLHSFRTAKVWICISRKDPGFKNEQQQQKSLALMVILIIRCLNFISKVRAD